MCRSHRLLLVGFAAVTLAVLPAAAVDIPLFGPIAQGPCFDYVGNAGDPAQGAISYSFMYQVPAGKVVNIGLADRANVTQYVPASGSPGPVGDFYSPAQDLWDKLWMVGGHLIPGQPTSVVAGGVTYIQADFEQVLDTQVIVGEAGSDFYLHGTLVSPGGQLPAMRVWGEQGTSVGRFQLVFELDAVGHVPDEPASQHGKTLAVGTKVYWDGTLTLGSYVNGEDEEVFWTFSPTLYDLDFGGRTTGRLSYVEPVPEPGSLLLLIAGGAWVIRRRVASC